MHSARLVSVVETPEFIRAVDKLLTEPERAALVDYLAGNPTAGDLVPGTGGVRKVRWALAGRGKSGGARVIHFFHDAEMPLFLLTAYAKGVRANLTQSERNSLRRLTGMLVEAWRTKR